MATSDRAQGARTPRAPVSSSPRALGALETYDSVGRRLRGGGLQLLTNPAAVTILHVIAPTSKILTCRLRSKEKCGAARMNVGIGLVASKACVDDTVRRYRDHAPCCIILCHVLPHHIVVYQLISDRMICGIVSDCIRSYRMVAQRNVA